MLGTVGIENIKRDRVKLGVRNVSRCGFCALDDSARLFFAVVVIVVTSEYEIFPHCRSEAVVKNRLSVGQQINAVISRPIPVNVSVMLCLLVQWSATGEKESGSDR